MNIENRSKRKYGVQKRLMRFSILQLVLVILIISSAVTYIMREYIKEYSLEKYQYINMRLGISIDSAFDDTDKVTDNYSKNTYLQQSLLEKEPDSIDKSNVNRALSYFQLSHVDAIIYVDNKQNVYPTNLSYSNIEAGAIYESPVYEAISEDYSKTRWIWMEDTVFDTGKPSLFIARLIRHIDYSKEPGLLLIQMNDKFFDYLLESANAPDDAAYYILSEDGRICYEKTPADYEDLYGDIQWLKSWHNRGSEYEGYQELDQKVVYVSENTETGFRIVTMVPNDVVFGSLYQLLYFIFIVFLAACIVAGIVSAVFAREYTKPIKEISRTMLAFDGSKMQDQLVINTGTELDSIGESYNRMVGNIQMLLRDIKIKEQELYESELNSLIHQINPHFLYNTLDNVYMIARLREEEEIMKMIQSLSRFLRIGLNGGEPMVSVVQEVEHACYYMNIQQIRNNHHFSYGIKIDARIKSYQIIKLILQPVVENALKHGLGHLTEGGRVIIHATEREDSIYFHVYNNGRAIMPETLDKLNRLKDLSPQEAGAYFEQAEGGYGIKNVISRLKLAYRDEFDMHYVSRAGFGTICTIKIPM